MNRKVIVAGILKDGENFLIVKRKNNDELFPGRWEFPGGHLEDAETISDALSREVREEVGYNQSFDAKIVNYTDAITNDFDTKLYVVELDFVIEVNKNDFVVTLSEEHDEYKWVRKDSESLTEEVRNRLKNA